MCVCTPARRQLRDVTKAREERNQAHDEWLSHYMAANTGQQKELIVAQERAAENQQKMLELENELKMLRVSRVQQNLSHEIEKAKANAEAVSAYMRVGSSAALPV